jgi:hypothetical protein
MITQSHASFSQTLGVFKLNEWLFVSKDNASIQSQGLLKHKGSHFICSRSSGLNDYHAEWRYYPNDMKYRLLIAPYHSHSDIAILRDTNCIHTLEELGDVMLYIVANMHIHSYDGEPISL